MVKPRFESGGAYFGTAFVAYYTMSMIKYTVILFIALLSPVAFCADSLKVEVPVRLYDRDGYPIDPDWIDRIHIKDCDINGWKYTGEEYWFCKEPRYENDPIHGSNGGWELA